MKTKNLELRSQTPQHMLALMEGAEVYERTFGLRIADGMGEMMSSGEVSESYREMLRAASGEDPWRFGFLVYCPTDHLIVGSCGFKGPPDADGVVEIAYGIASGYRGRGFATEVAQALVAYAVESEGVRMVCAHTLPEANASTRVLAKSGFCHRGEVTDPEDGLVWRWEYVPASGATAVAEDRSKTSTYA